MPALPPKERGRQPPLQPPRHHSPAPHLGQARRRSQAGARPLAVDDRGVGTTWRDAVTDAEQLERGRFFAELQVEMFIGCRWERTDNPVDNPLLDGPGRMVQKLHAAFAEACHYAVGRLHDPSDRRPRVEALEIERDPEILPHDHGGRRDLDSAAPVCQQLGDTRRLMEAELVYDEDASRR